VLRGAQRSLERRLVRFALLDLILADLYQGQARVDEVFRCLLDHQLQLVGIYDFHSLQQRAGWRRPVGQSDGRIAGRQADFVKRIPPTVCR
jgi:hypothetical protein